MKNKKPIKNMLKKDRSNQSAPPPMKIDTNTQVAPTTGFFSILSQGLAFGAGSSIGHKAIDTITASSGTISGSDSSKSISCNDIKKSYELCVETNGFCEQIKQDYMNCLEKFYLLNK